MANQQKMAAMMQTGSLSAIAAETATFEKYAQAEYSVTTIPTATGSSMVEGSLWSMVSTERSRTSVGS